MKGIITLLIILLLSTPVYGNDDIYSVIDQYNLDSIQISSQHTVKGIFDKIIEGDLDFEYIVNYIFQILFSEIRESSVIFKSIIFICILNGMVASISNRDIEKTASIITYAMTIALCTGSLRLALDTLKSAVEAVINIINSALPVILSLLALNGYVSGVSIAGTLIYGFISVLNNLIKLIIIPCICYYTACMVINSISPKTMLARLGNLFYRACTILLKITAVVFSSITGLLKIYMQDIDATASRLAVEGIKIIPVVGDIFSTGIESATKLICTIKSGFGLALIIGIFIAALIPVIKIFVIMAIYKISSALIEPIGDKAIVELIDNMGNANTLILITIITVAFMLCMGILILMTGFMGG